MGRRTAKEDEREPLDHLSFNINYRDRIASSKKQEAWTGWSKKKNASKLYEPKLPGLSRMPSTIILIYEQHILTHF